MIQSMPTPILAQNEVGNENTYLRCHVLIIEMKNKLLKMVASIPRKKVKKKSRSVSVVCSRRVADEKIKKEK